MYLLLQLSQQEELTTFFDLFTLQNLGRGLGSWKGFLRVGRNWLGFFFSSYVGCEINGKEKNPTYAHVSIAFRN